MATKSQGRLPDIVIKLEKGLKSGDISKIEIRMSINGLYDF